MGLEHIKGSSYYLASSVNAGVILGEDNKAIIIDTGLNDTLPRTLSKELNAIGYQPGVIINTHFHPDHVGGNRFIQKRFNCTTYGSPIDKAFIEHTILEPFYLYSAYPPGIIRNKFFIAQPSTVDHSLEVGKLNLLGKELDIIDLKGHSPEQRGILTEDGVLYSGDGFFGVDILEKHKIPYFSNLDDTLESLNTLLSFNSDFILPSHGNIITKDRSEITANIELIQRITQDIITALEKGLTREGVIKEIVLKYDVSLNAGLYFLIHSNISCYLTSLMDKDIIAYDIKDGEMIYKIK